MGFELLVEGLIGNSVRHLAYFTTCQVLSPEVSGPARGRELKLASDSFLGTYALSIPGHTRGQPVTCG